MSASTVSIEIESFLFSPSVFFLLLYSNILIRVIFKVEFAVQMSGPGCAAKVENCLKDVSSVNVDISAGRVTVVSELPWIEIQEKIEKTGRRAVLCGFGGTFILPLCQMLICYRN